MSGKKCNHCQKNLKEFYVTKGKYNFCDIECGKLFKEPKPTTTKKKKKVVKQKSKFSIFDWMRLVFILGILGLMAFGYSEAQHGIQS